jgi:hypothetical protein
MLKKKTTNRKFYGKWLYKVTLNVPGITILRTKSLENVIDYIENQLPYNVHPTYSMMHRVQSNEASIKRVCKFLLTTNITEWTKRIESNSIDIYTNNKLLYKQISETLSDLVIHCYEPANDMLANESQYTIITKKLPHNRYRYKVYLRPHKLARDKSAKLEFIAWMTAQNDKISLSESVKMWFITTDWNWDRRYVFVDNEQTLLLLKMRNCDAIGKVYEYKIGDK